MKKSIEQRKSLSKTEKANNILTARKYNRKSKEQKHEEAQERQRSFDKKTLLEKLDGLPIDGAKRQRERYNNLLMKTQQKEKYEKSVYSKNKSAKVSAK